MTSKSTYANGERARASSWKSATSTLPTEAKVDAPYVRGGVAQGEPYPFCLPVEFASHSLLPEVRSHILELFTELDIPWHASVNGGPSNHLLSSQVQCVNALGQMVNDPERLVRAFGAVLGTKQVHPIEPGRFLTFEFIGSSDYLNEAVGGVRQRGANCTSVDAAFVHTTTSNVRELILLEWKYTERYTQRHADPASDATRLARYGELLDADDCPLQRGLLAFEELVQEPLYQLMRQQLLAHQLEKHHELDVDRVRVAHVLPPANLAYQQSLFGAARERWANVKDVWSSLLVSSDRFVQLDSALFCDPLITSAEYCSRYGSGPN